MELSNLFTLQLPEETKISKGLEILGIKDNLNIETKEYLLYTISNYIFENIEPKNEKVFDLMLDYKYYYSDFYKLGIDLNKDDISWWTFNAILEGIFLNEESTISKVIKFRTYKKPQKSSKSTEAEQHKFYMERKKQFSLPNNEANNNLDKLWNYIEKRGGKTNE